MPSGRRHDSITLWTLPWVAGITFERTRSSALTLLVSGGFLFSGLMFGPDLDIYSRHYQRWGPLRWIWLPYRRRMRHRSFWSHGPLVGTAGRIFYLLSWVGGMGVLLALVGAIAAYFLGCLPDWQQVLQQAVSDGSAGLGRSLHQDTAYWLAGLLGLELGAMSHSLCDSLGSAYGRFARPKRAARRSRILLAPPAVRPRPPASPAPISPPTRSSTVQSLSPQLSPPRSSPEGTSPREPQLPSFGRWLRR